MCLYVCVCVRACTHRQACRIVREGERKWINREVVFPFHEMRKLLPGDYHHLLFSRGICSPWTGEPIWYLKLRAPRFLWSHRASLGGSRVSNKQRCLLAHAGSSHPCCQGNLLRRQGSPLETIGRLQKQINRETQDLNFLAHVVSYVKCRLQQTLARVITMNWEVGRQDGLCNSTSSAVCLSCGPGSLGFGERCCKRGNEQDQQPNEGLASRSNERSCLWCFLWRKDPTH